MNIAMIGTGYVGLVTGACLSSLGHHVTCVDIDEEKIEHLQQGAIPIFEPGLEKLVIESVAKKNLTFTTSVKEAIPQADVVFLAVGTPPSEDGSADLQYVFQAVKDIAPFLQENAVVVSKSTVPVGTNSGIEEQLKDLCDHAVFIASNPEFLREGKALDDFMHPDRIVLGVNNEKAAKTMKDVYQDFDCPIIEVSIESAEMIKYASNAFLATKISFINEIANICEGVGANVQDVAKGMGLDPRIGSSFLNAGIGYGGSCFPKDVRALDQIAVTNGYDFKLLKAVIQINNEQRWRFYQKIEEKLGGLQGKKIAILGLAFKAETDDIRESIGVDFAKKMLEDGAEVVVYDPKAMDNTYPVLPNAEFADSIEKAVQGVDAIVLATEWNQFKEFAYAEIIEQMKQKWIFDGRNLLDKNSLEQAGFSYEGIGRSCG